jgi:alanine racemase
MIQPNSELIIDYESVRNNIQLIRKKISPSSKFMAIVKSNAYGHDLDTTVKALRECVDGFGVVRLDEAIHLRTQSFLPILMMQGAYSTEAYDELKKNEVWTTIHSIAQIPLAQKYIDDLVFWIKINTGMNRLGLQINELDKCQSFIKENNVLMTHLACADNPNDSLNQTQFLKFDEAWKLTGERMLRSVVNSAGSINFPEQSHDWSRVGIGMYGGLPNMPELKTAMTFRSQIIGFQDLKIGDRIGYGGRIKTSRDTKLAIVYCGYADGFPQPSMDGTNVRVNNHIATIMGRVSMDLISIDVTDNPNCAIGDWCEFWSPDLSINETALKNNLISYELMTKISPRVQRHYINV